MGAVKILGFDCKDIRYSKADVLSNSYIFRVAYMSATKGAALISYNELYPTLSGSIRQRFSYKYYGMLELVLSTNIIVSEFRINCSFGAGSPEEGGGHILCFHN